MSDQAKPVNTYAMTTKVVTGLGSLRALPGEIARIGGTRLAIVADEGVASVGLLARILEDVHPGLIAVTILVAPDPDVAAAEGAAAAARQAESDLVVAVGGGSALGVGKAVAVRLTNSESIDHFEGADRAAVHPAPTIAVPTTAGSGSEVSRVLVLHEPGRDTDLIVRVEGEEPRVAILDGTVLRGLPRIPMLYAGLDALSHSLESLWARRSTSFTVALAKEAASILLRLLPIAVEGATDGTNGNGGNDPILQELLEASCAANMACGNSGLALVHALSGAPAVHLPHGQQNGILLPHVAQFNEVVSDPETRGLARRLPRLYRDLDFLPIFPREAIPAQAATAMITASTNHPFRDNNRRPSTDAQLFGLLAAAGAAPTPRPSV